MEQINKHPLNVEGKYYVDVDLCLVCDCCVATAPSNFKVDKLCSFVFKQPTTPEEEKQCEQALHCCPLEAISNDG